MEDSRCVQTLNLATSGLLQVLMSPISFIHKPSRRVGHKTFQVLPMNFYFQIQEVVEKTQHQNFLNPPPKKTTVPQSLDRHTWCKPTLFYFNKALYFEIFTGYSLVSGRFHIPSLIFLSPKAKQSWRNWPSHQVFYPVANSNQGVVKSVGDPVIQLVSFGTGSTMVDPSCHFVKKTGGSGKYGGFFLMNLVKP